ncbi:hypothetical protein [Streptomyces chrestomyceticus]|uniref:hypothetical protein n=1 Tax=Streptomyces chrestomyceticus TaxID=68185 RepID=UPI003400169B
MPSSTGRVGREARSPSGISAARRGSAAAARSPQVALTAGGRERHDERQALLQQALDTALADYDAAALDSAAEVLRRLSVIYDRL